MSTTIRRAHVFAAVIPTTTGLRVDYQRREFSSPLSPVSNATWDGYNHSTQRVLHALIGADIHLPSATILSIFSKCCRAYYLHWLQLKVRTPGQNALQLSPSCFQLKSVTSPPKVRPSWVGHWPGAYDSYSGSLSVQRPGPAQPSPSHHYAQSDFVRSSPSFMVGSRGP